MLCRLYYSLENKQYHNDEEKSGLPPNIEKITRIQYYRDYYLAVTIHGKNDEVIVSNYESNPINGKIYLIAKRVVPPNYGTLEELVDFELDAFEGKSDRPINPGGTDIPTMNVGRFAPYGRINVPQHNMPDSNGRSNAVAQTSVLSGYTVQDEQHDLQDNENVNKYYNEARNRNWSTAANYNYGSNDDSSTELH
eukprot:370402_1